MSLSLGSRTRSYDVVQTFTSMHNFLEALWVRIVEVAAREGDAAEEKAEDMVQVLEYPLATLILMGGEIYTQRSFLTQLEFAGAQMMPALRPTLPQMRYVDDHRVNRWNDPRRARSSS